jgi:hemerythrin-like domain-containing protein
MTILLADLLEELREDHRNMGLMLDLLERDLTRVRDSEKPDYELIHDIMRYMTVYSDAVHHPKEDLLYSAMKSETPALADGLEKVGPEHRELAILSETLRNDVEAIASGAAVTRFRLVADMSDYVERLREHMTWEEEDLFQRADALVAAESEMFVEISHLDNLDPVFGPEREHSFANLLQNIKNNSEP